MEACEGRRSGLCCYLTGLRGVVIIVVVGKIRAVLATPAGRFVLLYALLLSTGFFVLALRPVNDHVVNPYTTFVAHEARIALNAFGEHARVHDQVLSSPRFSVAIFNGCNGLEALLVFVSGVLAFPASWGRKLLGVLLGFFAIQAVNVVRVVSLFYIGVFWPSWFSATHVFFWQSLIIIFGVVLWIVWVRRYALPTTP
jgi:exosortase H (IPTLxxWG-CTERM-specific)